MRTRSLLLVVGVLSGVVWFGESPNTQAPTAVFRVIEDLPGGGELTVVRDVTRVGGAIHAVGGAVTRIACSPPGCLLPSGTDTPFLWRSDGPTMEGLPDVDPFPTATSGLNGAWDITPDGRYIASQARKAHPLNGALTSRPVRVDASLLPSAAANTALTAPGLPDGAATSAVATSNDGSILYGNGANRAWRFDVNGATSGAIPLLVRSGVTDTGNSVALRGVSASGDVAVGSSFNAAGNSWAYHFRYSTSVLTPIPRLPGGLFNNAAAVSPDGDLVLVAGHNPANGTVEVYLWRASNPAVTQQLGTPNGDHAWGPGGRVCANGICTTPRGALVGGMTADGSVVAMNFSGPIEQGQNAYFRNQHGWFHLVSALQANGIDLGTSGWDPGTLLITGISSDGTFVFGAGAQNGVVKGFIAEFAAGVLASFNPAPAAPVNKSLVGAWTIPADDDNAMLFTADGVYYHITSVGFERGFYTFDGISFSVTTLFDTNGSYGFSDGNGTTFPATVTGDTASFDGGGSVLQRVVGSDGSIVGGWVWGTPTAAHNSVALVATPTDLYNVFDFSDNVASATGSDHGTYTWNPATRELVFTPFGGGLPDSGNFVTPSADGLSLHVLGDDGEEFTATRVVDPATIPVIAGTPLTDGSGVVGQSFNYPLSSTNTQAFSAMGLPGGLSIHAITGAITGTPTAGGQFVAAIKATSAEGVSDVETLKITVAIPTPVGSNVVVEPVVPEGQGPITLAFDQITSAGETTVEVLDLSQSTIPPPGNVSVGGVVYEVSTTATFSGLITLCFSYAGIDFGGAEPRLFHFENNVWVDITTSVDPETQTICGATTSLSPFAVLVSHVVRTGFFAPINPVAGILNTAKGGTTIPLKFEVFVNGVEQTTITDLTMTQQQIVCDSSAPIEEVAPASVTGGTGLRYDETAGQFVFNWRVPNTPNRCYMVRAITVQDGLALTARFRVK